MTAARLRLAGFIAGLLLGAHAQAVVTTFDDRAAWRASTVLSTSTAIGSPTIQFSEYATGSTITSNLYLSPSGPPVYSYDAGGMPFALHFTGSDDFLVAAGPAADNLDWGIGSSLVGAYGGTITATFGSGALAVGVDLMSYSPDGATMSVQLASGPHYEVQTYFLFIDPGAPNDPPLRSFFGFTSDAAVMSVSFTTLSAFPMIANVEFTGAPAPPPPPPPAPVPELPTAALALLGLALLAARRR